MLGAIAVLVFGLNFLKGSSLFSDNQNYYAVYQHVDGLKSDNQVTVNGLKVGRVANISFIPGTKGNILVEFTIDDQMIHIPKNSIALIMSTDLLGSRSLAIKLGNDSIFIAFGDTIQSEVQKSLQDEVNAQVLPLKQKAEELIGSMDSAVTIVKMILNKDMRDNLKKSFESIKRGINTFEKTSLRMDTLIVEEKARIHEILVNFQSISSNFKKNNEKLTNVIENFSSISDTLAQANIAETMQNANRALTQMAEIMEKINNGDGSMGMLLHDDKLYKRLQGSADEFEDLLEDMRINPKRYVHFSIFGRRDKNKPKKKDKDKDQPQVQTQTQTQTAPPDSIPDLTPDSIPDSDNGK